MTLSRHQARMALTPGWLQRCPNCKMRRRSSWTLEPSASSKAMVHWKSIVFISIDPSIYLFGLCTFEYICLCCSQAGDNLDLQRPKPWRPAGKSFLASPLLGTLNIRLVCSMPGCLAKLKGKKMKTCPRMAFAKHPSHVFLAAIILLVGKANPYHFTSHSFLHRSFIVLSCSFDVLRSSSTKDWWSAGGHPRQWEGRRPDPHVADLMGLPRRWPSQVEDF